MAGLGRRTFAPGEVLTASNVMNYLQDQAVMNFADDGARGSALGSAVSEGMVSYLADTDNVEVYRAIGTAAPGWSPLAYVGDTSSVGLIPVRPSSVVIATGSGSANDLGVVSFTGASSVSLNDVFTSGYTNYKIIFNAVPSSTGTINLRFRNAGTDNTSTNYTYSYFVHTNGSVGAGAGASGQNIGLLGGANTNGLHYDMTVYEPLSTQTFTSITHNGLHSATGDLGFITYTVKANTFDGFSLIYSGTFSGNVQVFGYNG